MSAIGRELEFMNIEPAMANDLWLFFNRSNVPRHQATAIDVPVTITNPTGMIHNSLIFSGESEKATW